MKKGMALFLVLALVMTSGFSAFAADKTTPSDVTGTSYAEAVKALMDQDIVSGYPDGTFKPDATLNRAEACTMAVKAKGISTSAVSSGFSDVDGTWSQQYVAAAAKSGIVSGYPDATFKPANEVSIQELAAMILNAQGHKDLTGTWPSNYIEKAKETGLNSGLSISDWSAPATRGLTAQMVYNMVKADSSKDPSTTTPAITSPAIDTNKPSQGGITPETGTSSALTNNGTIFAAIEGVTNIRNKNGESTKALTIAMNKLYQELPVDSEAVISSLKADDYLDGQLYEIRIKKDEASQIWKPGEHSSTSDYFKELTKSASLTSSTAIGSYTLVEEVDDSRIKLGTDYVPIDQKSVIYVVEFDGDTVDRYRTASTNSITKGCLIRGYDASDDDSETLNVIFVIKKGDINHYKSWKGIS